MARPAKARKTTKKKEPGVVNYPVHMNRAKSLKIKGILIPRADVIGGWIGVFEQVGKLEEGYRSQIQIISTESKFGYT